MGRWRAVAEWFGLPVRASETFETDPRPIDRVIHDMRANTPGHVGKDLALSVPAVLKGRNMICSVATLPLQQVNADNEPVPLSLLTQIDPDVANVVTLSQTLEDLLFEGLSWWRITAFGADDYPTSARHVDVGSVSLDPPPGARPSPLPGGHDPRGATVWVDGVETPGDEMIRFDSPNPAFLVSGAKAIRRALLLNAAAATYADDPRPQDYFTPVDGADPAEDDEIVAILDDWKAARKQRSTGYVPAALKYNTVDQPSPADLQLVELQKQVTLDIANALGVDPEDLGVSTTSRTYANAVDRRRDRINDVLSPYMQAVTGRLSMGDVTKRGYSVRFDLDDYLRADPTTRWNSYKVAKELGVITVEEIRLEEGMPETPLAGTLQAPAAQKPPPLTAVPPLTAESWAQLQFMADDPKKPYGNVQYADPGYQADKKKRYPLDSEDHCRAAWSYINQSKNAAKYSPKQLANIKGRIRAALKRYGVEVSEEMDADIPTSFDADVPVTDLTIDVPRRIIRGRALPYGETGLKFGRKFRFAPGALRWAEMSRVKLLRDHDRSQAIGVAVELSDTAGGFDVAFKVARGEAGDRALALAEDGVLDGLSVGVDVEAAVPDPQNRGGVLVNAAILREVTLTAMPAFDSARVTSVAASRTDEGITVDDETTTESTTVDTDNDAPTGLSLSQEQAALLLSRPGALQALAGGLASAQQPAVPAAPQGALTLSADQVDALVASGQLGALLGVPQLTPAPAQASEKREQVNPKRPTAATFVREEQPYRFDRDGNLMRGAEFDFSTDLVAGSRGDGKALERATTFMRAQFDQMMHGAATFDVDRADVTGLNPNKQRPEMYVDQREYRYPIWDRIRKGTLADSTPFVFPKFNTATGLVAAHTEGVEPTPGAFTATTQTITPTPNSGKVEITREAWDQGGNPQMSGLIWRQMVRAWFESLEASAVAVLDAATPTGITLTTGGGTTGQTLDSEITAAFAALHFIRGGFSMDTMFSQVDLYKALIAAKDTTGRRLYPALGPSNASGSVSNKFGAIDINGVLGLPAWALAATGVVAASSYLFDSEVVHGWASAPERLQFEYRVAYVDVAIWGYKATAISDINGVREIIYDPVV